MPNPRTIEIEKWTESDQCRFDSKRQIDMSTGCVGWMGAKIPSGYGTIWFNGRTVKVHRVAYLLAHGNLPALPLDHLCRNKGCTNPNHLEPVSVAENTRRAGTAVSAVNATKSQCKRGHILGGDNVTPGNKARGWRICRECQLASARRRNLLIRMASAASGVPQHRLRTICGTSEAALLSLIAKTYP